MDCSHQSRPLLTQYHTTTSNPLAVCTVLPSVLLQDSMPAVLLTHHFTSGLCRRGQRQHPPLASLWTVPFVRQWSTVSCSVTTPLFTAHVSVATVISSSPLQRTVPSDCGMCRESLPSSATEATPTPCGTLPSGI